jgi:4-hydroxybenzoate polyprenyltransferase
MRQDLAHFIRLSRPVNVGISATAFGLACFLIHGKSFAFLLDPPFWAVCLTIVVIAATGYWINDVYDFRIDRINKPRRTIVNAHLSVKKVISMYLLVNFLILTFSLLYLGVFLGRYNITFINLLSVLVLYVYASHLKRVSVAGNLAISFLIALVLILSYYLYDTINMALVWAIVFAFEITFIREITKDVQDIKGDLAYQLRTLPIQIGIRNTQQVLSGLYVLFLASCYLPFALRYAFSGEGLWAYLILSLLLVQLPMLWIMRHMLRSREPEAFGVQSAWLKFLMLTGMLTLVFIR